MRERVGGWVVERIRLCDYVGTLYHIALFWCVCVCKYVYVNM